jgi:hypothetical protein
MPIWLLFTLNNDDFIISIHNLTLKERSQEDSKLIQETQILF